VRKNTVIRVVCCTGDPKLQPLLASALGPGYRLDVETDKTALARMSAEDQFDVLILDFDSEASPEPDGANLLNEIANCRVPVVVMADERRRSLAMELLQRGASDCLRKPPSLIELRAAINRAYERVALQRELARTQQTLRSAAGCDQMVGSSGRSQIVYDLIRRVADLNANVLIRGESGTGKELIARAIHNLSRRAKHPFVAVACGALPETLIEAELFGHEKGAFTGTTGTRDGYLAMAGEGTILLDEIGELSLPTQVKLLRVLQEKEFCRLGSNKVIPLRARLLFATHRSLERMVDEGNFRADLFFRIKVMTITAPPLRERTEDIPAMARHFLEKYSAQFEKPVDDISPAAMSLLVEYDWPGNVRELENAIQAGVIMARDGIMRPEDLPEAMRVPVLVPDTSAIADSFEDRLRQFKVQLANEALARCNGNRTLAARTLSISRAYLHRLIRNLPDETDAA
jgi:DNA-binding NtrC family response regulator